MGCTRIGGAILLVLLLMMPATAAAESISFGSVGSNQQFDMFPGDVTTVNTLAFFNYGEKPLEADIRVQGSPELGVSVTPQEFTLDSKDEVSTPTDEFIHVYFGDEYVKAVPVTVRIRVPENLEAISRNDHQIKVVAEARTKPDPEEGIRSRVTQSREYTYRIHIPGNVNTFNESYEETIQDEELRQQYADSIRVPSEDGTPSGTTGSIDGEDSTGTQSPGEGDIDVRDDETGTTDTTRRSDTPSGFITGGGDGNERKSSYLLAIVLGVSFLAYTAYRRYR